jgi:molybdopterin molybdotransferase
MKHKHDLYPMLSVEEALERVLSMFEVLEPEQVPLLDALGRVLAQDVYADIHIPPHDNSAMDGYAILADDVTGASAETPARLQVIENLAAGYVADRKVTPGTAIRIMTGAPVPDGADSVVRFERTRQEGEWVEVFYASPPGNNIRRAGEDVHKGDLVLPKGTRIRPQEIGMLASLGCESVNAIRRPRVAILATGDELADIDEPLGPGKIRNSNSYSNAAQVIKYGGVPVMLGIARDKESDLTTKIRQGLDEGVDLFLTSGGVSVGDFDMVKTVLAAEGEMTFWRVRMKPGKPLAFGRLETADGRTVPMLGMPGNPVSVMVSFEVFARPAIFKMRGVTDLSKPRIQATLVDAIASKDERRHFVRVRVTEDGGEYRAELTGGQGSGILNSMVMANGLAIISEDLNHLPAGSRVEVILLDD